LNKVEGSSETMVNLYQIAWWYVSKDNTDNHTLVTRSTTSIYSNFFIQLCCKLAFHQIRTTQNETCTNT